MSGHAASHSIDVHTAPEYRPGLRHVCLSEHAPANVDYSRDSDLNLTTPIKGYMKIRKDITCPLELTHDIIKGKWKPIIIWNLKQNKSLSVLEKSINGISQKMLLEHLKELIEFKIVDKISFEGYPLKVEYYLTERGKELLDAIVILQKIGSNIQEELKTAD